MSKSTSMLPTLAGGSGVAAHTLVDADLMKVVDSVTLNADRDRKVTLGELAAYFRADVPPAVEVSSWTMVSGVSVTFAMYTALFPDSTVHIKGTLAASGGYAGGGDLCYTSGDPFGLETQPGSTLFFVCASTGITPTFFSGALQYRSGPGNTYLTLSAADAAIQGKSFYLGVVTPKTVL